MMNSVFLSNLYRKCRHFNSCTKSVWVFEVIFLNPLEELKRPIKKIAAFYL